MDKEELEAIQKHLFGLLEIEPSLILLLRSKFVTTNMWKFCIQREPSLFPYMRNPSEELILFGLSESGANLKWLFTGGKNDEGIFPEIPVTNEMLKTAINNYPPAILDIPESRRTKFLIERACDLDPSLMRNFDNLRSSYVEDKINENPANIQYLEHPDEELIIKALHKNPNIVVYIKEFTPKIRFAITTLCPDFVPMIPALQDDV